MIELGSLHPTRDFTFVTDTARGFIQEMNCSTSVGEVTNIGSGFEISIKDTVQALAKIMGVEVKVIKDDTRLRPENSEVDRLYAGITKAEKSFNWKPMFGGYNGFLDGLKQTSEWFLDSKNLSHYKVDLYNV